MQDEFLHEKFGNFADNLLSTLRAPILIRQCCKVFSTKGEFLANVLVQKIQQAN